MTETGLKCDKVNYVLLLITLLDAVFTIGFLGALLYKYPWTRLSTCTCISDTGDCLLVALGPAGNISCVLRAMMNIISEFRNINMNLSVARSGQQMCILYS